VQIGKNKAARIFTGAPIPVEADTVVMQEKTLVNNSVLEINDPELQKGSNIRNIGSEIANGVLGLTRGTRLTPGAIGFLATIGKDKIPVFPTPRVSIIVTGKEIRQPGERLQHGQVYECNSFTLRAALRELQITDIGVEHANDEPEELKSIIAHHLNASDVLLITGGVSVGDYDFVTQALKDCEVEKVFHRVKQRPGKPLFFGKIGNKIVFGLPGNPSSVLSCYYQYVVPGIERIMQFPESTVLTTYLPLTSAYIKKRGLTYFLRGIYNSKGVTPLGGQESYKLQSFANANCLICLPEDEEKFEKDELVEVHILHT
jgi:molybdopterin molybdotransferase